jgi:23S rRNA (cytosine1962-C5)-methyltransferase
MPSVVLKQKAVRSLIRKHPWIFSGGIAAVEGDPQPGDTVDVLLPDRTPAARGAFSPPSQIPVRIWTFSPDEEVGTPLIRRRVAEACATRATAPGGGVPASCRLVNAESDGLPGVTVDKYGEFLVCQFMSCGAEKWREAIVSSLAEAIPCRGIYERSDGDARTRDGLEPRCGLLTGEEPPEFIEIAEGPCRFLVNVRAGHKTGFYLDQRENRALVAPYAAGRDVLNAFAYTGAFGIRALAAGARHVTAVDTSSESLALAERNAALNGFGPERREGIAGDAFHVLRRFRDARRSFDLIVLDPPKFAETRGQVPRASRGYKDINLLAFKLLRPGGILFTFSCSAAMEPDLFQKIVADAALDAGRDARILHWMSQAPDHPTRLAFPEGSYLTGLV